MLKGYKDLIVWQKFMTLVKLVYKITDKLPRHEQYVLVSQILRCAISIPSNIAEGWSRNRKFEFIRFFEIAYASSAELETQLLICKDIYPINNYSDAFDLITEVQKMLSKMIQNQK
jgi:four helix bundle protein